MQFVIPLAPAGDPLVKRIYTGLRKSILSGALPTRGKLPSTRELATQLGVSRTVVVLAYEQLLAEGFVSGRMRVREPTLHTTSAACMAGGPGSRSI